METVEGMFKRFGDEKSTLLDQYERLSFEVQLNQAIMLGRSLSEPAVSRYQTLPPKMVASKPHVKQGRRSGFQKVMKKLFSPILGKKGAPKDGVNISDANKDPMFWKTFSKSVRV